ncbi:uncharacterized protein LOC128335631 isoform X2 [Hemicordylus capensis]|uniref:uncharacterized protein LOC128335631 isoform X2 n=1 Tax=Hemicordylus capensis TaxID=884348 RepID=UPI002303C387|nr:uncharacterized protein LOC128335631 isoform X2 [Hemicordylus capensis]
MLICCFLQKMEKSRWFAPVLLGLIFQQTEGGERALAGNGTTSVSPPALQPAPEARRDVPFLQQGSLRDNPSEQTVRDQASSPGQAASPLETPTLVAQPVIWRESPPERPEVIRLFCWVPEGKVEAIEWKRDGRPVLAEKEHHLPANLSVLSLPSATAPHCGSYSCSASNALGWKESPSLSLTFVRISAVLEASLQISVSALVLAGFCGWGILLPFCQSPKLAIRGKAGRWLNIFVNCLACLASALALVAIILWIHDQGLCAAFIFPILFLLHVVLVTGLVVVVLIFQLEVLRQVSDHRAQRMLDFTTPGGAILVGLTCGFLVKHILKLQEEGCAEPVDLMPVLVGTAGFSCAPLLVIVVHHCMDLRRHEVQDRITRREKWKELQALTMDFQDEKPPADSLLQEVPVLP